MVEDVLSGECEIELVEWERVNEVDVCLSLGFEELRLRWWHVRGFEGRSIITMMMSWCVWYYSGLMEILLSILLQYRRSQRVIASSSNVRILLVGHGRSRDKEQLEVTSSGAEEEHAPWTFVTPST